MVSFARSILAGTQKALSTTRRKWLFLTVTLASCFLLFSLPVLSIPANSFALQLSIMRWSDLLLCLLFPLLLGLVIVLHIEWRHCCRTCETIASAVGSGSSVLAALSGGLFGTAACASCIVGVLGLLGVSTSIAFALLDYGSSIVWGALLLTGISIILTARRIARNSCTVPPHP